MAYKEPGAYLNLVNNLVSPGGQTPALIPLIIGSGAKILSRTELITRGTGDVDVLPVPAKSILSIGVSKSKNEYAKDTDYTFSEDESIITWTAVGKRPDEGSSYYVTFTYEALDTQYEPQFLTSVSDVEAFYGPDLKVNEPGSPINPISLGCKIALEAGAPAVWALQVKPNASGTVGADEYQQALDKYAKFMNVYKIVPVDASNEITAVVQSHVNLMSMPEERMERTAIFGFTPATAYTSFNDVLNGVGNYAESLQNRRICVVYPDVASKVLSDGLSYDLGDEFIACAVAGLKAGKPVQASLTKSTLTCFNELKGIKMTRSQKNLLAAKGVMILEQPGGPGTAISVRHQLTTDMTNAQTREDSVVAIGDYCSMYLRTIASQYIGKYNITPDTITRIKGALAGAFNVLIKLGVIIKGGVTQLAQDEDNPDTLIITANAQPPYPCNYIEMTLFLD